MKKAMLAVAVASFCGTLALAQNQQPAAATTATQTTENKNAPVMTFKEDVHEFGTIKQGDKVEYTFEFTNTGNEPLIITEAHGSCGCTVPEWPKEPIAKGQKGKIFVTFNSAGKLNMQDKTVTINSNAANSPYVLHMKGNVAAPDPAPEAKPAEAPKQ